MSDPTLDRSEEPNFFHRIRTHRPRLSGSLSLISDQVIA